MSHKTPLSEHRGFRQRRPEGFSFVELLLALSIAAACIITAVIAFQAASQSNSKLGTYGPVSLSSSTYSDFYGTTNSTVYTYFAPNYGRVAVAEMLRSTFYKDLEYSSAVFCLARNGLSTIRPTSIAINTTLYPNFDGRTLGTPQDFQSFLAANVPASTSVFTNAYRGAAVAQNLSIFMLSPSSSITSLTVRCVYELDLVPCASPLGTYVSVRRYDNYGTANPAPTDFYDIFYPASSNPEPFEPVVVEFERYARLSRSDSYDPWKVAQDRPFYFMWWPDPASPTLEGPDLTSYGATDPRSAYAQMASRTSFFMVFPMFPAL